MELSHFKIFLMGKITTIYFVNNILKQQINMEINLSGYITSSTSYGLVTLNLLKALVNNGVTIALHGADPGNYDPYSTYVHHGIINAKQFNKDAPSLRIAHQFDMAPSIGSGPRIGYTFFEVNQFTPMELHHLRSLDALIVPSQWAKRICEKYEDMPPIYVCSAGYDETIFKPVDYMPPSCIFLSVGKWEVRKQQDQIVEAFSKAFSPKDNVKLWMSCDNRFIPRFVEEKKIEYKKILGDRLNLIERVASPHDLARIIQQSYCFVAPSLAEGWNLPLLEAMGCGKLNICTNYSGHTEFCDARTSLLIQPDKLVPAIDNMWFKDGSETNRGEWCSYSIDHLIHQMQLAYEIYNDGSDPLDRDALKMAESCTWNKSAQKMKECIQDIQLSIITQRNQNMGFYE